MFSPSGTARTILLALFLCLVAAVCAQASGRAERESRQRLGEVERLIEEKRYNEAVRLLSQVVKEDTDRFDAAEELMMRIRERRKEIDESFAELNNAITTNNLEQAVALIDRLEDLNPYPSDSEAELLDMLRAAGIEQIYFVNLFRDLMARARAQLQAGEYRPAISTYLEGFRFNKDRFDEAGYGNIVENAVNTALRELERAIDVFDMLTSPLESATAVLGEDPQSLASETGAVVSALTTMAESIGKANDSGSTFRDQNGRIRANSPEDKYDLFLYFAEQLVFGPTDSDSQGIAYALDKLWQRALGEAESRLLSIGGSAYAETVANFREGKVEQVSSGSLAAAQWFEAALQLQSLWPVRIDPADPFPLDGRGVEAMEAALPAVLRTQEHLKALAEYRELVRVVERTGELARVEITTLEQIYLDREELAELLEQTSSRDESWRQQRSVYSEGTGIGLDLNEHVSQADEVLTDIENTRRGIQDLDLRLLDRIALVEGADFEERLRGYESRFEEAVRLQEGIEVSLDPNLDEVRLDKYPARALGIYQSLDGDLENLDAGVQRMLADSRQNPEYLQQSVELQTHVRTLENLSARTASLRAELESRTEETRAAALQAERFRREGQLRFQQARANVNNRRFTDARQNIRSAREAFDTSLEFEEDAEVRRIRDEELVALSELIIELENDQVVVEVRELIERGRRLYAQGDFTGAEQTLRRAKARWDDTNSTDNPEISFWLGLVLSAVDATTGREIAVTDPLYKEMSQLYNLAYADFQTGQRLVEQGENNEALRVLRRAEERIAKILVPFPYNARARVLNLRILQISAPEEYRASITELFNDAVRRRNETPQESYAKLKDIEQLQPNYPGLQNAIINLEVTLGFRIPPPDPAKITQAQNLYTQAKSIWDRNQRDLFDSALSVLDDALRLNPDNREAAVLKDRLLVATGGERVDVLSSDDQRLLREAEAKYLSGRFFEALLIIEQLLRKSGNQNNQEILDLEKRIRAKTGAS